MHFFTMDYIDSQECFLAYGNDLRTIQGVMNNTSSFVKWQHAFVYLDEVVLFPKTPIRHTERVPFVLTHLQDDGVASNLKTREFCTSPITYLGKAVR